MRTAQRRSSVNLVELVHGTSAEFGDDESETEALGLETLPSRMIAVPRIAAAPVNPECRLHRTIEFGSLRTELIVGEVMIFHVRDEIYDSGKIDSERLRLLARLGGPRYMSPGEVIESERIPATFG